MDSNIFTQALRSVYMEKEKLLAKNTTDRNPRLSAFEEELVSSTSETVPLRWASI